MPTLGLRIIETSASILRRCLVAVVVIATRVASGPGSVHAGYMRWIAALAGCFVLAAACLGSGLWWAQRELTRPGPALAAGAIVSIPSGQPFARTARQLEEAGLVRHAWLLRAYARWQDLDRSIRSGDFRIDGELSPIELLDLLRSTQFLLSRVTLREGLTVAQIGRLLAESGFGGIDEYECLADDAAFLADLQVPITGLEGYLFPDTYTLTWRSSPEEILRGMVRRFREEAAAIETARIDRGMSLHEVVTLASIIERETGVASERPTISAVFHNRMRIGMRLQSDPTAIYPWKEGVPTAADLRVDTPYNTYTNDGLPPGPICNPGAASLAAAVNPGNADYLYFVSRGDGSHAFARSLREHNRNVAALRRAGRANARRPLRGRRRRCVGCATCLRMACLCPAGVDLRPRLR